MLILKLDKLSKVLDTYLNVNVHLTKNGYKSIPLYVDAPYTYVPTAAQGQHATTHIHIEHMMGTARTSLGMDGALPDVFSKLEASRSMKIWY